MLSRALGLATVMLLVSSFAAERALAQAQNLEAGKSPSQIFAGTCNICHKSPRGLLKTVAPGSLPGFLRQHYTTSSDMAGVLASYLVSNGASDARYAVTQQKGAKDGLKDGLREGLKDGTKDAAREGSREAARDARPDLHSAAQPDPTERFGRKFRSAAPPPPTESSEPHNAARVDVDSPVPPQPAIERAPEGRKSSAKQKLSRRAKSNEDLPKADPARDVPGPGDMPKSDAAKSEPGKPDGDRSGGEGRSESARTEPPSDTGETSALRADPVPPVTPAPPPGAAPSVSAAAAGSSGDSAAMSYAAPAPALTISAPPSPSLPPVPPAGPPAPPISK